MALTSTSNTRGAALMVVATAAFIGNDTLLKLALPTIPPFETLFFRGLFTVLFAVPLILGSGEIRKIGKLRDKGVVVRSGFELLAVLGYIFALKFAPIADATALGQLSPLILTLCAVWLFHARIGRSEICLICLAFLGALMVAQPGGSGFSPFALLGLWSAMASAGRDLSGRWIPSDVPGLLVPLGAGLAVMIGAGAFSLAFEQATLPSPQTLVLIVGSGALLTIGQFLIFTAYRIGSVSVVAPFFYTGTVWALLAGFFVFGALPNLLAFAGIVVILVGGIGVLVLDARRNWVTS